MFKDLQRQGWDIEKGIKALKLRHPKYGFVSCSLTPSCPFFAYKVMRDIRHKINNYKTVEGAWKQIGLIK